MTIVTWLGTETALPFGQTMATLVENPCVVEAPLSAFREWVLRSYFRIFESLEPCERAASVRPTDAAISKAWELWCLANARRVIPSKVVPSMEGGVGICFVRGGKYADLECFNTAELLGVISDRKGSVDVFEVDPLNERNVDDAISRIGLALGYAQNAVSNAAGQAH